MESAESLDKNFKAAMLMDGPMDGKFTAKLVIKDVTEEIARSNMELEAWRETCSRGDSDCNLLIFSQCPKKYEKGRPNEISEK